MGVGAASAVQAPAGDFAPFKRLENAQFSKEGIAKLNQVTLDIQNQIALGKDLGGIKRTYTDRNGVMWNAQFLLQNLTLGDILEPNPETNEPFTLAETGFGLCVYLLWQYEEIDGNLVPTTQIIQYLCWPTMYMWEQYWTWDGEKEWYDDKNWDIPVDLRDIRLVTFEDFCNENDWQSKTFTINGQVYPNVNPAGGVQNWISVPMQILGVTSWLNQKDAYPIENTTFTLGEYDASEHIMNVNNVAIVQLADGSSTRTLRCNYTGTGRLEGFNPTVYTPAMGDVHIFNAGVISSDILGDDDPYYRLDGWSEVQAYYVVGVGEYMDVAWKDKAPFVDRESVAPVYSADLTPAQQTPDKVNYYRGYMFSNVGQEPNECQWNYLLPEWIVEYDDKGEPIFGYNDLIPTPGTFHSAGYNDAWADVFGCSAFIDSNSITFMPGWYFTVGSTEGTGMKGIDYYHNDDTMMTKTGKVYYHYNKNNMSDMRELSAVGTYEVSAVESVVAEMGVKVAAANGEINVVAADAADVTVYALNGAVVKSAKLAAGETMSVKADKGLYIVKAGKNAVKVVL